MTMSDAFFIFDADCPNNARRFLGTGSPNTYRATNYLYVLQWNPSNESRHQQSITQTY